MAIREIELHPGHWKNPGSGANGLIQEVPEARKVTRRVYEILKASNVPCTYFEDNTSSNQNQNLNTLVNHHNQDRDALVVSIHFNASAGTPTSGIGTEVLYYDQKALASRVAKAISDATGGELKNRGAKPSKVAVLARTYEPAILIEVCFVNSRKDVEVYKRDFEKICQAIARVLASHIGYTLDSQTVKSASPTPAPAKPTVKRGEDELFNPSNQTMKDAVSVILLRLSDKNVHGDKAIDPRWRDKFNRGEMTVSDALGLIFTSAYRGTWDKIDGRD